MTLAEAVEKFRAAILDNREPDTETLKRMAELVELNYYEWSNIPRDEANQKWADWLLEKAKKRGWFRLCINQGLLSEKYIHWPNENWVYRPKLKEAKSNGKSVRSISGGAFERKRRKH